MTTNGGNSDARSFRVFGSANTEVSRIVVRGYEDLDHGAQYVPEEVERARRAGEEVVFVTNCGPCCWYWELPNGSRIFHCEQLVCEDIARRNGRMRDGKILGNAGPCPECRNTHTNGETVMSEKIKSQ